MIDNIKDMKSCIIEQKPIPISWLVFAALENVAAVVQVVHALTGNGSGDTANVPMVLQPTKSVCSVCSGFTAPYHEIQTKFTEF